MSLKAIYIHTLAVNHLGLPASHHFLTCDKCIGFIGWVFRNLVFVGEKNPNIRHKLTSKDKIASASL